MRNTISAKYIETYLLEEYGQIRQEPKKFAIAIRIVAKKYELDKKDLFHFVVDQASTIPFTLSYGFQTRYGRELMEGVINTYNNL